MLQGRTSVWFGSIQKPVGGKHCHSLRMRITTARTFNKSRTPEGHRRRIKKSAPPYSCDTNHHPSPPKNLFPNAQEFPLLVSMYFHHADSTLLENNSYLGPTLPTISSGCLAHKSTQPSTKASISLLVVGTRPLKPTIEKY